ncbi:DUF5076 domain-containing protein [Marinicauda salina]|uniref:DUF5076 domain-containing protein n=1 Tax=Marinicauda salina TaxID=2135793 RepID=A0A2U2BT55_9PROT|nr:DUF5076 domain-containing protein [Marinicauda salina]PWE17212.1 DUF5076 domain-containing protein [Marinicauda salina]
MAEHEDVPFFVAFRTAEAGMTVHIDVDQVENGASAGIMLADFARHFASALAQTGKAAGPDAALEEILELFGAEIDNPTDTVEGSIRN